MSTSSATGMVVAEIHAEREQQPCYHTTSRQPSATAAAARLPQEGPSPFATTYLCETAFSALTKYEDEVQIQTCR